MQQVQAEMSESPSLFTSKLQSQWTFWFDDKQLVHPKDFSTYQEGLKKLGSFDTLEDFWRHYAYIAPIEIFPKEVTLYLSRNNQVPAWETYPNGGCWILRVRKHNMIIDRLWEELCFACVGELFEHPDVVCVAVSTRAREDVISLWTSSTESQFVIGKKLKELCNLDESTQVDYKTFHSSILDGSSFKNAKSYVYNPNVISPDVSSPVHAKQKPKASSSQGKPKSSSNKSQSK